MFDSFQYGFRSHSSLSLPVLSNGYYTMGLDWLFRVFAPLAISTIAIEPDQGATGANGFHIFNAIHSAGRVFGSSLNHNGYGFFPAVIPEGTVLYHGSRLTKPPTDVQWLAFEIEHAETFAISKRQTRGGKAPVDGVKDESQKPLESEREEWNSRGYLQTYVAAKDLNVLYIDGMSAAKSKIGPLDSQDLILRGNKTGSWDDYMDEGPRARDICELITPWGYDGFVRMEIGFELVQCDFSNGLKLVDVTRTIMPDDFIGKDDLYLYLLARSISDQFDGLGKDRLRIDFSSMVSAYYYPIPVAGTDPERPGLHRLDAAPLKDLLEIQKHVESVSREPRRFTVNWQAVTDTVVSRFSERLSFMTSEAISNQQFVTDLQKLVLTYFDALIARGFARRI